MDTLAQHDDDPMYPTSNNGDGGTTGGERRDTGAHRLLAWLIDDETREYMMSEAQRNDQADAEPAADAPGMLHDADIGSGEKTPGEQETDDMVKSIPTTPKDQAVSEQQD
jgi:hypothetical protein